MQATITPFSGSTRECADKIEEFLEDVETAAYAWDTGISKENKEATNKTRIRIFRKNLKPGGDAAHWWYNVLHQETKKGIRTDRGRV